MSLKLKIRKVNTVIREAGCRHLLLHLLPLSILSILQKQQNSNLSCDKGVKVVRKKWLYEQYKKNYP
jgi:hypothetical protein